MSSKKYFANLIVGLLLGFTANSQTLTNYAVSRSNPVFSSIDATGSTFTWRNGGNLDDNRSFSQNLGFTFYYMGDPYTSVSVCTNGFIDFSTSTSDGGSGSGSYINSYIDNNLDWDPLIAPFWDDLYCNSLNDIKYNLSGTAPNRKFTIEWNDLYGYSFLGSVTFQCVIYENGGVIEFNYSTIALSAGVLSYTIGMNNSDVTETYTLQAANSAIFGTTPVYLISLNPVSNSRFTFTPPVAVAASGSLSFSNITNSGMNLNWTNWCPECFGYRIDKSLDNSSFSTEATSPINFYVIGGLNPSTTYYYRVYARSEGGISSYITNSQTTTADPGNIFVSNSATNWNTNSTWVGNTKPTSNAWVQINHSSVTLNTSTTVSYVTINSSKRLRISNNRTLTISNDLVIDGQLDFRGGSVIVEGNLIISSTGSIITNSSAGSNGDLVVKGNIVNNGSVDLYSNGSNYVELVVNGSGNQFHVGSGTNFDMNKLTVDKTSTDTLFVVSNGYTSQSGFLTLTSGCFYYAALGNVNVTPFSSATDINANSSIVMKASKSTMTFSNDLTLTGTLEVKEGNIQVGSSSSHDILCNGGNLFINGGTFTIGGCLSPDGSGTQSLNFAMSKGFFYTATNSNFNSSYYGFDLSGNGSKFNMSGGSIFLLRENSNQRGFNLTGCNSGTSACTAGAIIFGDGSTPSNTDFKLTTPINLYDIRLGSSNSNLRLESSLNCHSFANYEGALFANGYSIDLNGDWFSNGAYTPASNTTSFIGSSGQVLTNTSGEEFASVVFGGTAGNIVTCLSDLQASGNVTVNANIALDLNSNDAQLGANFTNSGSVSASSSSFEFNGSSAQTLITSSAIECENVSVSNANGLSLSGNEIQIKGSVTLSNSADVTTNGFLTLLETTTYSGRIATLPAGTSVIGNVKVEKCVQGDVGYYGLGTVHSSIDFEQWDNSLLTTGFTGSDYPSYNFQSISFYNESALGTLESGFEYLTNTTNIMDYKKGYYVYVYPDNPGTYGSCYVKLITSGAVVQGNVSFNVSYTDDPAVNSALNDGWNLVNNCYPSAIDFDAASGWTKSGLNGACYVFDRSQNSGLGAYRSYLGGIGTNGGSRYIPSGQGYWVKANASSPTLQMTENVKVANFEAITRESRIGQLRLTLIDNQNNADEAALYDEVNATMHMDQDYDAYKLMAAGVPNIYFIVDDSIDVSIYGSNFQTIETIPVFISNPTNGTLKIVSNNFFEPNTFACLSLYDSFTNTTIDLNAPTVNYAFQYLDTTTVPRFYLTISYRDDIFVENVECKGDLTGEITIESFTNTPKTFEWLNASGGAIKTDNNVISSSLFNLAAGIYHLHVTDNSSCGGYDTIITITEPETATEALFFMKADTVQLENGLVEVAFSNQSINANAYQWIIDGDTLFDFSPTIYFTQSGNYTVELYANNGNCLDTIAKTLIVVDEDSTQTAVSNVLPEGVVVQRTANGFSVNSSTINWNSTKVAVFDVTGKEIKPIIRTAQNGIEVDLSTLPRAVYFLRIAEKETQPITLKLGAF